MTRTLVAILCSACVLAAAPTALPAAAGSVHVAAGNLAPAAGFELTVVADSEADGLDPFNVGCASINDRGDIGFRAGRPDPDGFNTIDGIYRADIDGTGLVTIAEDEDRFSFIGSNPSLNNRRQMSFAASLEAGGEAILRGGGGGRLTTIARTEPGRFNFFGFDTSLNRDGRVAFKAELDERFDFDEGLFSGAGGAVRTHYLASRSRFDGSDSRPSINDNGRIAFRDSVDFVDGIFVTRAGGFRTVTLGSDEVGLGNPQLNNRGQMAFERSFTDAATGEFVTQIVAGRAEPLTVVADTREEPRSFGFRPPSIADDGSVAYLADLDDGSAAVLLDTISAAPGTDPLTVVRTGEVIDGDPVTNLVFCEEGLGAGGRLAFVATLDDPDAAAGVRVVFVRATRTGR